MIEEETDSLKFSGTRGLLWESIIECDYLTMTSDVVRGPVFAKNSAKKVRGNGMKLNRQRWSAIPRKSCSLLEQTRSLSR